MTSDLKPCMRTHLARFAASAVLFAAAASVSLAGEAIMLDMAADEDAHLTVATGADGKPALRDSHLAIGLQLNAQTDPGRGLRLVTSQLYLKQAGQGGGLTVLPEAATGARTLDHHGRLAFAVDPLGPLARDAIALCAGAPRTQAVLRLDMSVPVVWRVTAGRLDFAALALSGLSASEDVLSSPALYTDAETAERESVARVEVRCEDRPAVRTEARQSRKGKVGRLADAAENEVRADNAAFSPSSGQETADASAEAAEAPATLAGATMVCDGGMVRQTLGARTGQMCLCPGNTVRRQTGPEAFQCARRLARRR
ncbi:MAG: hypothetical protein JNL45_07780 [Hyphomicrobium sp.]|jgi:hypothetical protein|nr:hypothetical protein [Hyphomicrobium sp.]